MDENRREYERFSVSLYTESIETVESPVHILNLSAGGFLVRGDVLAGQGGIFRASFRVHPSSGEMRVTARGQVMHARLDGQNSEFGIKILGFNSPDEDEAYQSYVRELAARDRTAKERLTR